MTPVALPLEMRLLFKHQWDTAFGRRIDNLAAVPYLNLPMSCLFILRISDIELISRQSFFIASRFRQCVQDILLLTANAHHQTAVRVLAGSRFNFRCSEFDGHTI